MNLEEKTEIVLKSARQIDGKKRLQCARAFAIHGKYGISLRQIGDICNRNHIKLTHCQLGCFK